MKNANVVMKQRVTLLDRALELFGFKEDGSCKHEYSSKVYFPVTKFYREELY